MKNLYLNSRLRPLLVAWRREPKNWVFSLGEPWLLLTPVRLGALARRLGLGDGRVHRLLDLVRRHDAKPELFCRRLGVEETYQVSPENYPIVPCPRCDGIHAAHPEDFGQVCPECRERERRAARRLPAGGVFRDRRDDKRARLVLRHNEPRSFDGETLSPNYKINKARKIHRDWDAAVNRVLMGMTYKKVARDFGCSVGLLHNKVAERQSWENN